MPAALLPVLACATCFSGDGRGAFLATTALLSLLPLALIGGGVWWVYRQHVSETP